MSYTAYGNDLSAARGDARQESAREIIGRDEIYLKYVVKTRGAFVARDAVSTRIEYKIVGRCCDQLISGAPYRLDVLHIDGDTAYRKCREAHRQLIGKRTRFFRVSVKQYKLSRTK